MHQAGVKVRSLVLGMYQLDGFTESEIPLDILAKIKNEAPGEASESMLVNWINRGFGSFLRTEPQGPQSACFRPLPRTFPSELRADVISCLQGQKFLLLGLGGGTLAHLVLQMCPESSIDAVEWSQPVLKAAGEHFGLSNHRYGDRLCLHHSEAEAFLRRCREENAAKKAAESGKPTGVKDVGSAWVWDAILIDLYSNDDLPPNCITRDFLGLAYGLTRSTPEDNQAKGGGRVAYNCGRALACYPKLCSNAQSLAEDGPGRVEGLHVCIIHPEDDEVDAAETERAEKDGEEGGGEPGKSEASSARPEGKAGKAQGEEEEENLIDNAILLLVGAATGEEAARHAARILGDAGAYCF